MPTIRVGHSKVTPFYPSSASTRRAYLQAIKSNSDGKFLIENPEIYEDDFNWWTADRLPDEGSERRIRIVANNLSEAIDQLSEHNLKNFTRLDSNNIGNPKNILRLIIIAFNAYADIKLHFPETAPRCADGKIIGYRTDYIKISDTQENGFTNAFHGRCIVTLDSSTINNLLNKILKNNWSFFWSKIVDLYEKVFDHYDQRIEEPEHQKVKYSKTRLEKEYIARKDIESTIEKNDLISMLENTILPEEIYSIIIDILKKDPNIKNKEELEKCS